MSISIYDEIDYRYSNIEFKDLLVVGSVNGNLELVKSNDKQVTIALDAFDIPIDLVHFLQIFYKCSPCTSNILNNKLTANLSVFKQLKNKTDICYNLQLPEDNPQKTIKDVLLGNLNILFQKITGYDDDEVRLDVNYIFDSLANKLGINIDMFDHQSRIKNERILNNNLTNIATLIDSTNLNLYSDYFELSNELTLKEFLKRIIIKVRALKEYEENSIYQEKDLQVDEEIKSEWFNRINISRKFHVNSGFFVSIRFRTSEDVIVNIIKPFGLLIARYNSLPIITTDKNNLEEFARDLLSQDLF